MLRLWREIFCRLQTGEGGLDTVEYLLIVLLVGLITVACAYSLIHWSAMTLNKLGASLQSAT